MFASISIWKNVVQTVFVVFGISHFLKKLLTKMKKYRQNMLTTKGIPCEKPHWLFGHIRKFNSDGETFRSFYNLMKRFPTWHVRWFGPFTVFIKGYCPDFMKVILNVDQPKDEFGYRWIRPWIGDGLLTSSGPKWKRNRRLLTPAFHFTILKKYLNCMNAATTELLNKWCEKCTDESDFIHVEMFHDIGQMALDNLLRCIMSQESGCQRNDGNEYLQAVKCITETIMYRMFNPMYHFDFIFSLSAMGRNYKRALRFAHDYTGKAIAERQLAMESGSEKHNEDLDFLDILLRAKDERGVGLTKQDICNEVDTFVFEGHDTVSSGISWALYNLASHPECQEKCRNEVNNVLGKLTLIEWNDLARFEYLTMFIKESLRRYPPVYSISRTLKEPMNFPVGCHTDLSRCSDQTPSGCAERSTKVLPNGTNLSLSIHLLHHHPGIWENPMKFDPERFTPENISKRSSHAYLPFSAGPRNCIGQNFAMIEMKVVLARILSTFRVILDEEMPKPEIQRRVILHAKNGIHLKLKRI